MMHHRLHSDSFLTSLNQYDSLRLRSPSIRKITLMYNRKYFYDYIKKNINKNMINMLL